MLRMIKESKSGIRGECEKMSNTSVIRELLQDAFDDEELDIFCYDYYRPVFKQFASGMSHRIKIQRLIEHCEKRKKFDELLPQVMEINRKQYDKSSLLQIEIILRGDCSDSTTERQSAAVGAFAGALNIPPDQIILIRWG